MFLLMLIEMACPVLLQCCCRAALPQLPSKLPLKVKPASASKAELAAAGACQATACPRGKLLCRLGCIVALCLPDQPSPQLCHWGDIPSCVLTHLHADPLATDNLPHSNHFDTFTPIENTMFTSGDVLDVGQDNGTGQARPSSIHDPPSVMPQVRSQMPAVANMQVPLSFLLAGYMLHELQQRSANSQHSAAYAILEPAMPLISCTLSAVNISSHPQQHS